MEKDRRNGRQGEEQRWGGAYNESATLGESQWLKNSFCNQSCRHDSMIPHGINRGLSTTARDEAHIADDVHGIHPLVHVDSCNRILHVAGGVFESPVP